MYRLYINEILDKISKMKTDQEKIDLLKKHDTIPLRQIMFANFSDTIEFLIPTEPANYKPNKIPLGLADTSLYREAKRLVYFFKTKEYEKLTLEKRMELWESLLSRLNFEEAEVLENLKNKNFEARYNLPREVVVAAFPGMLKESTSEERLKELLALEEAGRLGEQRGDFGLPKIDKNAPPKTEVVKKKDGRGRPKGWKKGVNFCISQIEVKPEGEKNEGEI